MTGIREKQHYEVGVHFFFSQEQQAFGVAKRAMLEWRDGVKLEPDRVRDLAIGLGAVGLEEEMKVLLAHPEDPDRVLPACCGKTLFVSSSTRLGPPAGADASFLLLGLMCPSTLPASSSEVQVRTLGSERVHANVALASLLCWQKAPQSAGHLMQDTPLTVPSSQIAGGGTPGLRTALAYCLAKPLAIPRCGEMEARVEIKDLVPPEMLVVFGGVLTRDSL